MSFPLLDTHSAPEASVPLLEAAERTFGFAPNLTRVLAASPAALDAYLTLNRILGSSSLTPKEQQVVILATSHENGCGYCMSAHSAVARMVGLPANTVEALREGGTLPDPSLDALARFTRSVVRDRGRLHDGEVEAFLGAGYSRAQVLEVLLAVAMKTLSNYTNHLADTPLDPVFSEHAWEAPSATVGG